MNSFKVTALCHSERSEESRCRSRWRYSFQILRFVQDNSKAKFVFRLAYAVILKNLK